MTNTTQVRKFEGIAYTPVPSTTGVTTFWCGGSRGGTIVENPASPRPGGDYPFKTGPIHYSTFERAAAAAQNRARAEYERAKKTVEAWEAVDA